MPPSTPDPGRSKLNTGPRTYGSATSLAEPVFAGLLKDWSMLGCVRITKPGGTPVNAASLSDVLGRLSGAATRGRCPSGTGWPAGGVR